MGFPDSLPLGTSTNNSPEAGEVFSNLLLSTSDLDLGLPTAPLLSFQKVALVSLSLLLALFRSTGSFIHVAGGRSLALKSVHSLSLSLFLPPLASPASPNRSCASRLSSQGLMACSLRVSSKHVAVGLVQPTLSWDMRVRRDRRHVENTLQRSSPFPAPATSAS